MAKIIKDDKWYDPEGLDIPTPPKTHFEGTREECYAEMRKLIERYENRQRDGISLETLDFDVYQGKCHPSHIAVYFLHAISKEYYKVVA